MLTRVPRAKIAVEYSGTRQRMGCQLSFAGRSVHRVNFTHSGAGLLEGVAMAEQPLLPLCSGPSAYAEAPAHQNNPARLLSWMPAPTGDASGVVIAKPMLVRHFSGAVIVNLRQFRCGVPRFPICTPTACSAYSGPNSHPTNLSLPTYNVIHQSHPSSWGLPIDGVSANIDAYAVNSIQVKHSPQVWLNPNRMDGATKTGGETRYFMSAQSGIKRINLEYEPRLFGRCLLARGKLSKRSPELTGCLVIVGHQAGGFSN